MAVDWKRALAPALVLCAGACGGQQADPENPGKPAPDSGSVGALLDDFEFTGPADAAVAWSAEQGLRTASETAGSAPARPSALFVHVFQPDCLACQNHARALERFRISLDTGVVGVAHKQDAAAVAEFARATGSAYPLVVGTGSEWAGSWGQGDPMYVVDRRGRIVYAQVGFHPSDPELWSTIAEDLAAGRTPRVSGPTRKILHEGDRFPAITLPDLDGGKPMVLATAADGRLYFERDGNRRHWRAAVGFFTRY